MTPSNPRLLSRLLPPAHEASTHTAISLVPAVRRKAASGPAEGPEGHRRGHLAGALRAHAARRARRARHPLQAARLDLRRMVQPVRHAGHRHPVLSRASAPDAARAQDDHRRRRRHRARVHAHPAPRGRTRRAARLSAQPPPPLAEAVRPRLEALSALLPARSGQQELRAASAAVVRAEPPGRGFRRDLRGLADAALELAQALRRLAGAAQARVRRRTDGGDRRPAAEDDAARPHRSAEQVQDHACRILPEQAGSLRRRYAEDLRSRPAPLCSPPIRSIATLADCIRVPSQQPGEDQADGREMDRRVPVHARLGARRHDRALPRAEAARGRRRAPAAHRTSPCC